MSAGSTGATPRAVVVLCTAPPRGERARPGASELAEQLVRERCCACVNVVPAVTSFFRWEGKVDRADESLLVIKTTAAALPQLQARLLELHPYAVPEVLALDVVGGAPAYLQWLADAVGQG